MDRETNTLRYLEWRATQVIGDLQAQGLGTKAKLDEAFEAHKVVFEERYGASRTALAASKWGAQESPIGLLQRAIRAILKNYDPRYGLNSKEEEISQEFYNRSFVAPPPPWAFPPRVEQPQYQHQASSAANPPQRYMVLIGPYCGDDGQICSIAGKHFGVYFRRQRRQKEDTLVVWSELTYERKNRERNIKQSSIETLDYAWTFLRLWAEEADQHMKRALGRAEQTSAKRPTINSGPTKQSGTGSTLTTTSGITAAQSFDTAVATSIKPSGSYPRFGTF
ncbi:uncharacterized protein PAC_17720 [Phialocephala subalpina]|uniref:Uncharacterized protein n=1 Tax=Phialocephala subalpina TaxID=576137 RepID=A0A1L7XRZ4_9HELO|nr:uncharacterized protein PAC_17720 [Phialocephala subalpina]